MTAAAYTTALATIVGDTQQGSGTGWSALGGGASGLNTPETDYYIQGTQCVTKNAFASALKGFIYDSGSDQGGSGTDGAYIAWIAHTAPNSLTSRATGGMRFLIGSSSSAYRAFYVGGNDTQTFLGWQLVAVNEATSADATTGSPTAGVEQSFGAEWNLSGGPTKGAPNAMDAVRFGRCNITITGGTAPDAAATFSGVLTNLETSTNRYGLLVQRLSGGAFENSGLIQFGTGASAVRFTDSNKAINLRAHPHVTANFHTWEVNNASSVVTLTSISVTALGTTSRGRIVVNNNATVNLTRCSFIGMNTFSFGTNTTVSRCTFQGCGQITHGGANMSNSTVNEYSGTANTSAVIYNIAADPDGEMDDMTFAMGATATHAIEFGTTSPTTMTLRGITFSGYNTTTNNTNDAHFHIKRSAGTVTINLVGCVAGGSNFTYRTDGATVVLVIDPVDVTVNVKNPSAANIQNARVFIETAAAGGFPFEASVSITSSAGTATVTHTAHGLSTNDWVVIRGAQPDEYNKVAQITVTGANSYTYSVPSGISSPATGSPVSSFVPVQGLTDASGNISASKTYSSSQAIKGWVRKKNATSPFYKDGTISGTVNNLTGFSVNVILQLDE